MEISVINTVDQIWKKAVGNVSVSTTQIDFALHKKLLAFFQVGDYYFYILNFQSNTTKVEFVSDEVATLLDTHPRILH